MGEWFRTGRLKRLATRLVLVGIACLTIFLSSGCGLFQTDGEQGARETQLRETELEINVQQTLAAQQEVEQGVASTIAAQSLQQTQQALQNATATPQAEPPDLSQTQEAQGQQATLAAQQTSLAAPSDVQATPTAEVKDLNALMKSASILLYEDMINYTDTNRYVKDTLNYMGLSYVDVGSAKGWLKEQLLSSGPDGQGWDLVIISAESKGGVSGEFFEYVLDALEMGSSVILEVWYLDTTYQGTASALLSRCGIEFGLNWKKIPPLASVMFPLDASHPILNEPNSGLSFTKTTGFWWDPDGQIAYDIGDLMVNSMTGDARLLVGTQATEKNSHGTLTVCMDGQLILQTFSSHQLTFDAMRPVWENYIYNALKVRFLGAQ